MKRGRDVHDKETVGPSVAEGIFLDFFSLEGEDVFSTMASLAVTKALGDSATWEYLFQTDGRIDGRPVG